MKTLKFLAIIVFATLLNSCESPQQPQPPKNNGITLESRLFGTWNSISTTPLGVAPEYEKPYNCFDYKVIIDDNLTYTEYYKDELSTKMKFELHNTSFDAKSAYCSGKIILENNLVIHFSINQDNLFLTPTNKGDDLITGGTSIHYKKKL